MKIGDYVNQKGSLSPIGTIESINKDIARVRWGVADGNTFEDDFNLEDLQLVPFDIVPPEEVIKHQAENARRDISKYNSVEFKSTRKT